VSGEHGRETRSGKEGEKRMFRISQIAAGSGSRQASRMRKWFSRSFSARINERIARGTSKLGLVVPTGFEPLFKDDYDFALYLHELRRFHSSQKGV
jgi:hypothetical protein